MAVADIAAVIAIARRMHVAYPEGDEVFFERQSLYPEGCQVLVGNGRLDGYVISHPWRYLDPPSLNVKLGTIPPEPTTYFIHDIVLLPEARGSGAGFLVVQDLIQHAASAKFDNVSLVAVKGSSGFWERHGFQTVAEPRLDAKLRTYDDAARYMTKRLGS